ncbi:MAG TPA: imidazole glycerol phosphate synthase subunit HisH [Thermomicrobiales bacterium]|nr:imidazole glycerol phosphate synthase subunit HisH [Thermomicrobiales bacterium]
MIAVVDYGAGNVQSVVNALESIGADAQLTADPAVIQAARGVIVPGVGAARDTMQNLERGGLVEPVMSVIAAGTPYLGVCMGMQALMTYSEEHGGQRCLDVVSGVVRELDTDLAVPHMGWNSVNPTSAGAGHPLLDGIPVGAEFYFVHSFACFPGDSSWVLAETDYGSPFPSIIGRDNIMSTQFHPEKSGTYGLRLLRNFTRIVDAGGVKRLSARMAGVAE